jgi:hypothetical protein
MESTKGYFYKTKATATKAIDTINNGENIPQEGSTTITYCEPIVCKNGFCISYDEVVQKYLGQPIDIEIDLNNNL